MWTNLKRNSMYASQSILRNGTAGGYRWEVLA